MCCQECYNFIPTLLSNSGYTTSSSCLEVLCTLLSVHTFFDRHYYSPVKEDPGNRVVRLSFAECTLPCPSGYTYSVPGSPCGCVIPMQVELQLGINLETLFPLVSELAEELAVGLFLLPSQVRIVGANSVEGNQEETDVNADFVPLVPAFDNTTADLLSSRFWNRQVLLNDTLFGNYSVISVTYPGMLFGHLKLCHKV